MEMDKRQTDRPMTMSATERLIDKATANIYINNKEGMTELIRCSQPVPALTSVFLR